MDRNSSRLLCDKANRLASFGFKGDLGRSLLGLVSVELYPGSLHKNSMIPEDGGSRGATATAETRVSGTVFNVNDFLVYNSLSTLYFTF